MRRLALASLIANIGIVSTGGLVRLTGSGLGCPSWPDCSRGSLVPTDQLSWHKGIEFGNRMLTYVVVAAVVAVFVAVSRAEPRREEVRRWAWVTLLGVPAQIVLGGVLIYTKLNPFAVAAHFMLSMSLIAAATVLWWRTRESRDADAATDDAARCCVGSVSPPGRSRSWSSRSAPWSPAAVPTRATPRRSGCTFNHGRSASCTPIW